MKALLAAALTTVLATPAMAADWTVDMEKSRLTFSGSQTGGKTFEGEFETFDAAIRFDPDDLASAMAHVEVDLSSASTHDKQRDAMIGSAVWLDAKSGPAVFDATSFEKQADGSYVAEGTLTLKGKAQPVSLPFTLDIQGDTAHATGSTVLHRADFGLGGKQYADGKYVGLDVTVNIDITATR
jgi:polyisoprenoid-binding protein YceI